MVILTSSAGVQRHREHYYADLLNAAGAAALIVDSFRSRGVRRTVAQFGKMPLEPAIQAQPRFIAGDGTKLDLGPGLGPGFDTGAAGGGAIAHGAQPKGQAKQGPWNRCRSIR